MTPSNPNPTPSEAVLVSYSKELEGAADPDAVFRRYAAAHPELVPDLEHLLRVRRAARFDPPPAAPTLLQPGDVLGAFRVRRFVARGGMGEVYEAWQDGLDRRVALKVSGRPFDNAATLDQFVREQQVPAQLHQTHVVPVHYAGRDEVRGVELWYYVMHFIDGVAVSTALAELYRRETSGPAARETPALTAVVGELARPLDGPAAATLTRPGAPADRLASTLTCAPPGDVPRPADRSIRLRLSKSYYRSVAEAMRAIGEAVGYLHSRGVRHRDVKPSNVMLHRDGTAYLIDFGLAHRSTAADPPPPPGDGLRPVEPGTLEYMAPEQFVGPDRPPRPIDCRADVYSLGVTLYELLTLRPAFRDPNRAAVAAKVVAGRCRPLGELVSNVPPDLAAICRKAMSPDPADRYATAGEFAADLARWSEWRPTTARPDWKTLRPLRLWAWRNKASAVAAVTVALMMLGATAWAFQDAAQKRREAAEADKQRQFVQALIDLQEERLKQPSPVGWSRNVRSRIEDALRIRPDADLRNQAASTFVGLDAHHVYEHPLPWPPQEHGLRGLTGVAFSPDGKRVVAGGWSQPGRTKVHLSPAMLWDGNAANKPTESTLPGDGPVAFPDADSPLQLVLPTGDRRSLTLWNVGTNAKVLDIPLPVAGITDATAALSADARFAAASYSEGEGADGKPIRPVTMLWGINRKQPGAGVKQVGKWSGLSTALAFSPDARFLAAGSEAGEVVVRSAEAGAEVLRFTEGSLPVTALGFGRNYRKLSGENPRPAGTADEWLLAVGCKGGGLAVWDLRGPVRMHPIYGSDHDTQAVVFNPDGSALVSAGRTFAYLWDVSSGRPLLRFQSDTGNFRNWTDGVAISPDGRRVAFGSAGPYGPSGLDVFELEADRGVRTYHGLSTVVEKVWLSPSGRWVAAIAHNWQLGVWHRATGRVAFVWKVPPGWTTDNSAVVFDQTEAEVLFASGRRVSQWNLTTGEQTGSWQVPLGLNDSLCVRPGQKPILIRCDLDGPFIGGKRPPTSLRARELGPNGEKIELYKITDIDPGHIVNTTLSTDGQVLLVNTQHDGSRRAYFYNGLKGTPIPFDPTAVIPASGYGSMSETGRTVWFDGSHGGAAHTHFFRFPDIKRLAVHSKPLHVDDSVKLGVEANATMPNEVGSGLYRVGEARPVVTFDVGRSPSGYTPRITQDGRFVYWGRRDGTVCVADVSQCVEQLTPFQPR